LFPGILVFYCCCWADIKGQTSSAARKGELTLYLLLLFIDL
jgi:hypothetical protein